MPTKKKPARARRAAADDRKPLLGALLRLAHQSVTEQVAEGLAAVGFDDLPAGYFMVVQPLWVEPEGVRVVELATQASISQASMLALVERLQALGYVARGRGRRVGLTDRGRALVATIRALVESIERAWSARFGRRRIEALRETLTALVTEGGG